MELAKGDEERLPDFGAKEYFVSGLWKDLKVKVLCEEPSTFCEAIRFARLKYRRLMFKAYKVEVKLPRWEPKRLETAKEIPRTYSSSTKHAILHQQLANKAIWRSRMPKGGPH